jgi:hypothetical protein
MTLTDYLLNGALVALVLLQIRGRQLSAKAIVLPLVIVGYVATQYLHSIPTSGNDLELILAGTGAGLMLGTGAGLFTRVSRRPDGAVLAKAGAVAAVLWILGVGARMAFELYATHGGGLAVERFSVQHDITAATAWTAALVLMAIAEVVSRTGIIVARAYKLGLRPFGAAQLGAVETGGTAVPATSSSMIGAGDAHS